MAKLMKNKTRAVKDAKDAINRELCSAKSKVVAVGAMVCADFGLDCDAVVESISNAFDRAVDEYEIVLDDDDLSEADAECAMVDGILADQIAEAFDELRDVDRDNVGRGRKGAFDKAVKHAKFAATRRLRAAGEEIFDNVIGFVADTNETR